MMDGIFVWFFLVYDYMSGYYEMSVTLFLVCWLFGRLDCGWGVWDLCLSLVRVPFL